MTAFAELLFRHRLAAGLPQKELASRSGLSERALRDLERGARTPRWHSARAVAAALALDGDDLRAFLATARTATPAPAATVDATPTPGDLVGRDGELRALVDLATGTRYRLVTVTGPAGVGKSRIVAELGHVLARRTDLEVRTLDLSSVREPELVGELVAAALDSGVSRLPPVDRAAAHLRDRRVVLLLDRFEQLVAAAPDLTAFLRRCPGLTLVVASQRPLQVRDERVVPLGPLAPDAAAALFTRRAAAVSPHLTLDAGGTAEAVAAICRRVEHLPLAIELAAARVRLLHPVELAERLDQQLQVLTGGMRDLPVRHRSLRAAIEASIEVVAEDARTLYTWLGAFACGVRLDDVEAVAGALGRDRDWLLTALTELVDINLVRAIPAGDGTEEFATRYKLPDAMAELAGERLGAAPDGERVARAVALRYLARLREGSDGTGRPLGDRDAANVRAAIGWAVRHQVDLLDGAATTAIYRYYETTGRLVEGEELLGRVAAAGPAVAWVRAGQLAALRGDLHAAARLGTRVLHAPGGDDHTARATAHMLLAQAVTEQGDAFGGRIHLRAALIDARRAGDILLVGRVLNNLSAVSVERGRLRDAERQLRAALEAKRRGRAGPVELGRTWFNLAEVSYEQGHADKAERWAGEAVPLLLAGGFPRLAALAESTRALALLHTAGPARALPVAEHAAQLLGTEGDDRRIEAVLDLRRSVIQHAAGELAVARDTLARALPVGLDHTSRDRDEVAQALVTHAWYLVRRDPTAAAALLGAGQGLRRRPFPEPTVAMTARTAAAARAALGAGGFAREHARGTGLDRDGLVALCDRVAIPPA
ncbi:ATP-binding protein [Phytohabitans houttuyneae]|uniref:XRE family transcriptional regulator n=1 Tax=Phytohabitans houttuyneae TaxID=1076126 RepID=A0A6V8KHE0_9ACTN|nr:helix-turn-helix domain-containing protein [Phytohabitans houttuyneae]GFJ81818.1 XRE family transcriptional regulator [Phytohabitans houttuyneae]